jgi:hypothetical protein
VTIFLLAKQKRTDNNHPNKFTMNKQNLAYKSEIFLFRMNRKAVLFAKTVLFLATLLLMFSASAQTADDLAVKAAVAELTVVNARAAYGNLTLPTTINGATITWSLQNEKLITKSGEVTRPKDR